MTLNFQQISLLNECMTSMQETKLPFKLSLILAKNMAILKQETDFYVEREREFAQKYLEMNEDGTFVQTSENVFQIKKGMEEECREARIALDGFTTEVELRKIPMSLVESMEFTPKQMEALEILIDEEA